MLLTISCTGKGADVLSWLLCKRPDRFQVFHPGFGNAYVFFPENSPERSTACLLLDIDSNWLNKHFYEKSSDVKYVSDRLYVSSSLLSSAISQVFGSALKGVCAARPDAVEKILNLDVRIENFPCRLDRTWLDRILKSLGYDFSWQPPVMEYRFPEWGHAPQGLLSFKVKSSLKNLLSQIFILLPVFDRQTHVWLGETELENFVRLASPWLKNHPHADFIIREYFSRSHELCEKAIDKIWGKQEKPAEIKEESLNNQRYDAICRELAVCGVKTVIDLGCGDGKLLSRLSDMSMFSRLAGMDISVRNIAFAKTRIAKSPGTQGNAPDLFVGSLTYRDKRIKGFNAAVLCEVIEHFEPEILETVMENVLGYARPGILLVTTPDRTYNRIFEERRQKENKAMDSGSAPAIQECFHSKKSFSHADSICKRIITEMRDTHPRHPDHRFEFTGTEFAAWCDRMAKLYGYKVKILPIGEKPEYHGAPTLMGVFEKCA